MVSRPSFQYQPPKVDSGKLRIPIHFYAQDVGDSPEPTDIEPKEVFFVFAMPIRQAIKTRWFLIATRLT